MALRVEALLLAVALFLSVSYSLTLTTKIEWANVPTPGGVIKIDALDEQYNTLKTFDLHPGDKLISAFPSVPDKIIDQGTTGQEVVGLLNKGLIGYIKKSGGTQSEIFTGFKVTAHGKWIQIQNMQLGSQYPMKQLSPDNGWLMFQKRWYKFVGIDGSQPNAVKFNFKADNGENRQYSAEDLMVILRNEGEVKFKEMENGHGMSMVPTAVLPSQPPLSNQQKLRLSDLIANEAYTTSKDVLGVAAARDNNGYGMLLDNEFNLLLADEAKANRLMERLKNDRREIQRLKERFF